MKPLVVKIGGSLYDWSEVSPCLNRWLAEHTDANTLLVPGGGKAVNKVRALNLDQETAHWLALKAMLHTADRLRELLTDGEWTILNAHAFCLEDDRNARALPHSWDVTSDSVAARAAELLGADLVLLKSAEPPPGDVAAWSAAGYVDRYFPTIVDRANLTVRAVNLRAW